LQQHLLAGDAKTARRRIGEGGEPGFDQIDQLDAVRAGRT
jgi:hypothetical protein